jgi:hypothetical protein
MRKHGGAGTQTAFGVLIDRLEYADDAALIDKDSEAASARVTRLCVGALEDADMEISAPKSEILFCRPRVTTAPIVAADYDALTLEHKCKHCGRAFDTKAGRNIHQNRHCKRRWEEFYPEEYVVDRIADVRGPPSKRYYYVLWEGWRYDQGTWTLESDMFNPKNWDKRLAKRKIKEFWGDSGLENSTIPERQGVNRCGLCNQVFARHQDLLAHGTRGCTHASPSRKGTRAERTVLKTKQREAQEAAGTVTMAGKRLKNVFNFKYLGFSFQADGDRLGALDQRMAIARSRFGELHEIWRSKKIATAAKVRIYACAVVSVLTYGSEIWAMTEKVKAKIRGWNARCLALITGRDYREETVEPSFDMLARLRSRRLRWAGHILRAEESNLLRRVLLAQTEQDLRSGCRAKGGLLMDVQYSSMEELLSLAEDRDVWRSMVTELLPEAEYSKNQLANKKVV